MSKLLPPDLDERVTEAVRRFWSARGSVTEGSQAGGRGSVIGGKNMDGIGELIRHVAVHCGCPEESVIISGKQALTLPGYFRPTKMWDALVIHRGHLLAAFELKSQVGSFGNNFNNRTEESLGSSLDLWTAHREQAFALRNSMEHTNGKDIGIRPFVGFLMLLEHVDRSTGVVRVEEPYFKVFPEFRNTSYLDRYRMLCEKLVAENLYTSACLIASPNGATGPHLSPTPSVSPKTFFASFAGALSGALEAME
ncbi:MAG: PaeR7I family type II restriction endonuclease [Flavobacteriales bacterium]